MQMKLETNLPIVFLTILVIVIVILGYLELKKLHERIKILEYLNKKLLKEENKKEDKPGEVNKTNTINNGNLPIVNKDEKIKEKTPPVNTNRVEEWQMNNEKENIINTLNRKEEYIEEINDGEQKIFFNTGGMYVQHPMIYKMEDNETDDIIEKIKNDEDINFEDVNDDEIFQQNNNEATVIEEYVESKDENEDKINIIEHVEDNFEEEEDNDVSGPQENMNVELDGEGSDESDTEITLKEITEEDDFSKNKIVVDESYSVNNLKSICKNLGLQLSGNKTTLIKRIMDNQ